MILDAIIGLFISLLEGLVTGISFLFVPVANLLAAAAEAIIGIFISGFRLGRLKRSEGKKGSEDGKPNHPMATWWSIATTVLICAAIFLAPKVINRKVTLVAKDGHSLPFAALIIHTRKGDDHKRTDNAGNITFSRFSTTGITLKDPRYVEQTWKPHELESQLVARRTILGSSLDSMADRLLKPAK